MLTNLLMTFGAVLVSARGRLKFRPRSVTLSRISVLCRAMVVLLVPIVTATQVLAQEPAPRHEVWVTDGRVEAIAQNDTLAYFGGSFSKVGPNTPNGALFDKVTGAVDTSFNQPDNSVYTVLNDGFGGFYIGGRFTGVGGEAHMRLAHILPDGSVDDWAPAVSGISEAEVRALALRGDTLYIGGSFNEVNGEPRTNLAAVRTDSAIVLPWSPSTNTYASIKALVALGDTLFVGGDFVTCGGFPRDNIAALSTTTGIALPWVADASHEVRALAWGHGRLYVGGAFIYIGSEARNKLAALDVATGAVLPWNVDPNSMVYALQVRDTTLFIAGCTSINGVQRHGVAAVDTSGALLPWAPVLNAPPTSIAVDDSVVYFGGGFGTVNGELRHFAAAVTYPAGATTPWDARVFSHVTNDEVSAVAINGTRVYVGGFFSGANAIDRLGIMAVDLHTGAATSWNAQCNGYVRALALDEGVLYAGGDFTFIGPDERHNLAAFDVSTGAVTSWDPSASSSVLALAVGPDMVYVGGFFVVVGGFGQQRMAAVDKTTGGLVQEFEPGPNGRAEHLAYADGVVYASGPFSTLGGSTRRGLGAVDANTGSATPWNPDPQPYPCSFARIVPDGDTIYLAGDFTTIGGQPRNHVAAVSASTGLATDWDADVIGTNEFLVAHIGVLDTVVIIGGPFEAVGDSARSSLAAVSKYSGAVTAWDPGPVSTNAVPLFAAISVHGQRVILGGTFLTVGLAGHGCTAVFGPTEDLPTAFPLLQEGTSSLRLWPNPADDQVFLHLDAAMRPASWQLDISDTFGRTVLQQRVTLDSSGRSSIALPSLPAGMYLLALSSPSQRYISRMVRR